MTDFKIFRAGYEELFPNGELNPRLIIEEGCWYLCTDTAELFVGANTEEGLTLKRVNEAVKDEVIQTVVPEVEEVKTTVQSVLLPTAEKVEEEIAPTVEELKAWVDNKDFLQHVDLTGYATEEWVEGQGYLTEHQDLSEYADKTYIANTYATKSALNEQVSTAESSAKSYADSIVSVAKTDNDLELSKAVQTLSSKDTELAAKDADLAILIANNASSISTEMINRARADDAIDERLDRIEAFFGPADKDGTDTTPDKTVYDALDTLREIQDYIINDGHGAADLLAAIDKNAKDIDALSDTKLDASKFTAFANGNSKSVSEIETAIITNTNAAEEAAKKYTADEVAKLTAKDTELNTAIGNNTTAIGTVRTNFEAADLAINTKIGTVADGKDIVTMISDAQSAAEAAAKKYTDDELAGKADKQHTHDGYLTALPEHTHDQYLTEHQSLEEYAKKTEIPDISTKANTEHEHSQYLTEHQSLDGYATEDYVTSANDGLLELILTSLGVDTGLALEAAKTEEDFINQLSTNKIAKTWLFYMPGQPIQGYSGYSITCSFDNTKLAVNTVKLLNQDGTTTVLANSDTENTLKSATLKSGTIYIYYNNTLYQISNPSSSFKDLDILKAFIKTSIRNAIDYREDNAVFIDHKPIEQLSKDDEETLLSLCASGGAHSYPLYINGALVTGCTYEAGMNTAGTAGIYGYKLKLYLCTSASDSSITSSWAEIRATGSTFTEGGHTKHEPAAIIGFDLYEEKQDLAILRRGLINLLLSLATVDTELITTTSNIIDLLNELHRTGIAILNLDDNQEEDFAMADYDYDYYYIADNGQVTEIEPITDPEDGTAHFILSSGLYIYNKDDRLRDQLIQFDSVDSLRKAISNRLSENLNLDGYATKEAVTTAITNLQDQIGTASTPAIGTEGSEDYHPAKEATGLHAVIDAVGGALESRIQEADDGLLGLILTALGAGDEPSIEYAENIEDFVDQLVTNKIAKTWRYYIPAMGSGTGFDNFEILLNFENTKITVTAVKKLDMNGGITVLQDTPNDSGNYTLKSGNIYVYYNNTLYQVTDIATLKAFAQAVIRNAVGYNDDEPTYINAKSYSELDETEKDVLLGLCKMGNRFSHPVYVNGALITGIDIDLVQPSIHFPTAREYVLTLHLCTSASDDISSVRIRLSAEGQHNAYSGVTEYIPTSVLSFELITTEEKADDIPFTEDIYVTSAIGGFEVGENVKGLTVADMFAKLLGLTTEQPGSDEPPYEGDSIVDTIMTNQLPKYQIDENGDLVEVPYSFITLTEDEALECPEQAGFYQILGAENNVIESGYHQLSAYNPDMPYMIALPNMIDFNTHVTVKKFDDGITQEWVDWELNLTNDIDTIRDFCESELGCEAPEVPEGYTLWADLENANDMSIYRLIINE